MVYIFVYGIYLILVLSNCIYLTLQRAHTILQWTVFTLEILLKSISGDQRSEGEMNLVSQSSVCNPYGEKGGPCVVWVPG